MAKKTTKKMMKKTANASTKAVREKSSARNGAWGLTSESRLSAAMDVSARGERRAEILVVGRKTGSLPKEWREEFPLRADGLVPLVRTSDRLSLVRVLVNPLSAAETETDPNLISRPWTRIRDAMGALLAQVERYEVDVAQVELDVDDDGLHAAVTGLEIALYRYKRVERGEAPTVRIELSHRGRKLAAKQVSEMATLGQAVNIARHLVNLPPNALNPVSYADFIQRFYGGLKNVAVKVYDERELERENMGLHLAVGAGAEHPPRLVHLRYRPNGSKSRKPIALVGKGITFDSGGLNLKPGSGMRLMKKDMGGSAAVLGTLYWAARSGSAQPLDVYVALAENAVSSKSFRPSDVIGSRAGISVEIHNTDAEGRLVLADALDLAAAQNETPQAIIDVATLTGAIKVALGGGLAGLFSNDVRLQKALVKSAQDAGDWVWPMPLVQKYKGQLNSNCADMVNATDGFGGAVTAALFLERFAKGHPWAHLDIFAWKDSAEACWLEGGGSGQSVMGLAAWLREL